MQEDTAQQHTKHVIISANDETGLIHESIAMAESITTVSKKQISFKLGFVNDEIMRDIENSILLHIKRKYSRYKNSKSNSN